MKRSIDKCFYYTNNNVFLSIIHSMRHAGHLLLHQQLKGDIRVFVDMHKKRKGSAGKPSSRQ